MPHQLSLPGIPDSKRIVNVASVPHRSPFRYPGGKTWLVPRIRQWLASLPARPAEFIEPFAGGAIVGLTVAFEKLADHVTLVELDEKVAAVWQVILGNDGEWLANSIIEFDLTFENVEALLKKDDLSLREQALQTIVKNRVNRGGILAPGAGMQKYGEGGKGIASRWYPETLAKRILAIVEIRDRISFVHGDGMASLEKNAHREDVVFFIDPPYTAAGKKAGTRLYTYSDIDHKKLFQIANTLKGNFLMTYENVEGVHRLAHEHTFDSEPVAMKTTHHAKTTELLIGRDVNWSR